MSRLGRFLVAVGVAALAAGTAFAVAPGVAAETGVASAVAAVGNAYFLVAGVGLLALLWAVARGTDWAIYGARQATMPDAESFVAVPTPGGEFDEAVAELGGERERAARPVDHREKIRERLRRDAVDALVVHEGYDRQRAREAVDAGTWTEDRFAAAFVAAGEDAPRPRWYQRLWRWLRRADPFAVRARRAADELADLGERDG